MTMSSTSFTGGGGVIETTSSSSLSTNTTGPANPISTLEKQYAFPLGQRLVLGVQANAACCLEGGVEGILKQLKNNGGHSTFKYSTATRSDGE